MRLAEGLPGCTREALPDFPQIQLYFGGGVVAWIMGPGPHGLPPRMIGLGPRGSADGRYGGFCPANAARDTIVSKATTMVLFIALYSFVLWSLKSLFQEQFLGLFHYLSCTEGIWILP
jgi:hypothetical protein